MDNNSKMKTKVTIGKNELSFGGKSLSENLQQAEIAILDLEKDFRIHNHSNTGFAWEHFVLQHPGGLRNIRQITAEINSKRMALNEAKHRYVQQQIELEQIERRLKMPIDEFEERSLQAEYNKIKEGMELAIAPIEGAVKDVLILKRAYDELLAQREGYTEEDLEREEIAYWIRRLFNQALCDIREYDRVSRGNQEAIGQLGLNISAVIQDLMRYLEKEKKSSDLSNDGLIEFLNHSVEKYSKVVIQRTRYQDFPTEPQ